MRSDNYRNLLALEERIRKFMQSANEHTDQATREEYAEVRAAAQRIINADPHLPDLPPPNVDPKDGLTEIFYWWTGAIVAESRRAVDYERDIVVLQVYARNLDTLETIWQKRLDMRSIKAEEREYCRYALDSIQETKRRMDVRMAFVRPNPKPPVQKGETTGAGKREAQFTDTEENILEALGDRHMRGPTLLKAAGYDYSSHYRAILSNLVKREILGNDHSGYFRR